MAVTRSSIALGLILIGLAACTTQRPTGTWRGERDLIVPEDSPPHVVNTLRRVQVEFLPESRFKLQDAGILKGGSVHIQSGNKVRLSVDSILDQPWETVMQGQPRPPDIIIEFKEDDSALFTDPSRAGQDPVILQRVQP